MMSNRWSLVLATLCCAFPMHGAVAMDAVGNRHLQNASLLESTYLIDVQQGSHLSQLALGLRDGGYELAGGQYVSFRRWYRTNWTDASITWLSQLTGNLGLIFGLSTGERGRKYTIDPGLKLGLLMQTRTGKDAYLSLRATTVLGGELREKSCSADYGEIGGVQEVNCRLAAGTLPPAETLKYLLNEKPYNQHQVGLMLTWRF